MVLGFFPQPFLDRCKAYRSGPMRSDLIHPDGKRPFIISARGKEVDALNQKVKEEGE